MSFIPRSALIIRVLYRLQNIIKNLLDRFGSVDDFVWDLECGEEIFHDALHFEKIGDATLLDSVETGAFHPAAKLLGGDFKKENDIWVDVLCGDVVELAKGGKIHLRFDMGVGDA